MNLLLKNSFKELSILLNLKNIKMDIQADKIQLAKMILDTENPKIIESIKKIFKTENPADFWDNLTFEQRKEIEDASLEIGRGEVVEYESFMKKHR